MQQNALNQDFSIYFKCENSEITPREVIASMIMLEVAIEDLRTNFLEDVKIDIKVKPIKNGSVELIVDFIVNNPYIQYGLTWVGFTFLKSLIGVDHVEQYIKEQAYSVRDDFKQLFIEKTVDTKLFIKNYLKYFLMTPNEELEKNLSELPKQENINLDKSTKARSDFFLSALEDSNTDGIAFYSRQDTLIPRKDFHKYIRDDIIRDLPDIYTYKEFEIIKPVLKIDSKARWGVLDKEDNTLLAVEMRDKNFKRDVIEGMYPLKTSSATDVIKCSILINRQLKNGEEEIKKISILQVFTFNSKIRIPLPDDFDVKKMKIQEKTRTLLNYYDS